MKILNALLIVLTSILLLFNFHTGWNFNTDLSRLVPNAGSRTDFLAAEKKIQNKIENEFLLMVSGPDEKTTGTAAKELFEKLNEIKKVKMEAFINLEAGVQAWKLYQRFNGNFLSTHDEKLLQDGKFRELALQRLAEVYSPTGSMSAETLVEDPFGLLTHFLKENLPRLPLHPDSQLLRGQVNGQDLAIIRGRLLGEWKATSTMSHLHDSLSSTVAKVANAFDVHIDKSGYIFYNYQAFSSIRTEISLISTLSILGILTLFLFLFRSLKPIFATFVVLIWSASCALIVTHWWFGEIHLFSLLFGTSLLGMAVDYCLHFFSRLLTDRIGQRALTNIRSGLMMSCLSTIMGFLFFALVPFAPLKELAVFISTGLASAVIFIFGFFPSLHYSLPKKAPEVLKKFTRPFCFFPKTQSKVIPVGLVFLFSVSALCVGALIPFRDDVKLLHRPPVDLKTQEQRIQQALGTTERSFLLVRASSEEELLQRGEEISRHLKRQGLHSTSPSDWIPSQKQQVHAKSLTQQLSSQMSFLVDTLKLSPSMGAKIQNRFEQPFQPLLFDQWAHSLADHSVQNLWLGKLSEHFYMAMTVDSNNPSIISLPLSLKDETSWLNPAKRVSVALQTIRKQTTRSALMALLAAMALIFYRYGWRKGMVVFLIPGLASTMAIVGCFFISGQAHLFTTLGAILVFALGLDYTFFHAEDKHGQGETTALAILSATVTSCLAFGLLALSSTAAVASFGWTVFIGLSVACLLSPLARRDI